MDAVYKEDPATIRARSRATLAGYGLEAGEIDRWQNTPVLSPTRQLLLLKAAAVLNGVDGRGELFRRAMGLTTDAEAQVYAPISRPTIRSPTSSLGNSKCSLMTSMLSQVGPASTEG